MFTQRGEKLKSILGADEQYTAGGRPKKALWLALGLAASILHGPNDRSSGLPASERAINNFIQTPIEHVAPTPRHSRLEAPCQLPPRPIGTRPDQSTLADADSDNPLLACLGSLEADCWGTGAADSTVLCLDYNLGSVIEDGSQTRLLLTITANGTEFYDYTLHTPYEQCQETVTALNEYARQKFAQLPAAGNLIQTNNQVVANGWTTGCLSQQHAARILGNTIPLS